MDADREHTEDDLNALERRLASWRPADDALNPDTVLFAAGQSRNQRWMIAAGLLALTAVGLGLWAGLERSARLELVRQFHERRSTPAVEPPQSNPSAEEPSSDSYLTARHLILDRGLDSWGVQVVKSEPGPISEPPDPTTSQAWRRELLIVP